MTCAMKKFHLKVKGATVSNPFTSTGGHEVPVLDRTLEFWRKKLQRFRTMLFSQTGGGGGRNFYSTLKLS